VSGDRGRDLDVALIDGPAEPSPQVGQFDINPIDRLAVTRPPPQINIASALPPK
jgi:hypothetical protein